MPGRMPPTSQLDWLISTTAMIVLFWSRGTRDLLKSFGWGIATLHRLIQRRSCHPRRPPHSISPLEGGGFELSVPRCEMSIEPHPDRISDVLLICSPSISSREKDGFETSAGHRIAPSGGTRRFHEER